MLSVEIFDVSLDTHGRPAGAGSKVHPHQFGFGRGSALPHVTAEDRLIIRRLQTRLGDVDDDGCLVGPGGSDILTRMIDSGRARFGTVRGPVLHFEEPIALSFEWRHDAIGNALLSIPTGDRRGFRRPRRAAGAARPDER